MLENLTVTYMTICFVYFTNGLAQSCQNNTVISLQLFRNCSQFHYLFACKYFYFTLKHMYLLEIDDKEFDNTHMTICFNILQMDLLKV